MTRCVPFPSSPPPTADALARATYERIASGANVFLMGDHLGYFDTDDPLERVGVRCLDDTCAAGFARFIRSNESTVEHLALDLLDERRGVSLVVEEGSTDAATLRGQASPSGRRVPLDLPIG